MRGYISERDGPLTGYALNGSELSLVDAFASGFYRAAKPPHFASVSVFANLCIVGRHLATEDDPIPGKLGLSFPLLAEWFHHNPYNSSPNPLEVHEAGTLLDAELPSIRSRLRSFHSIGWKPPSYRGYSSDVQVFLYFEPDDCNTAQRAVRRAFSCTGLWSIFCGAHIAPSCIFFQETIAGDQAKVVRTHVFLPVGELAFPDNLHPRDVLLPFETIGDRIGVVVDNWLSKERRPPPYAVDLFLRAFRQHRRRRFAHEVFQNLVAALEALATAEGIGAPLMNPAFAKDLRKCLKKVIEERCLQGDVGDVKENLLRYVDDINRGTLRQKLVGFRSILPHDACARFVVLKEPLLTRVVETRNYHAHGGSRNSSKLLDDEELFQATDQLQLLVLLLLLCAVGVDANMVMAQMLKRSDFGHILRA